MSPDQGWKGGIHPASVSDDWRWALARVETYGDLAFQFKGSLSDPSIEVRWLTVLQLSTKSDGGSNCNLLPMAIEKHGLGEGFHLQTRAIVSWATPGKAIRKALEAAWDTKLIKAPTPSERRAVSRAR